MNCLTNVSRSYSAVPVCSFKCNKPSTYPIFVNTKGFVIATGLRKNCVVKATSSPTPSANMEGAKDEEKSDVYSTNMTEAVGAVLTYRHELGMNYNFIRPDIIVGSCLQTPADVDKLRSIKVKTIYCLQQDSDLEYFSVDISAIREYASTFDDIQHLRAEIRDFDGTDLRLRLPAVVSKLHKAVNRNGGVTYIHCTAGLGRAPSTALAYMFWVQGYKLNNALSLLLRNRKCFPNVDAIKSATADILAGLKKRSVTLTWNGDNCSTVEVSGLDVGWDQRIPLKYEKHGSWILQRDLLDGRYEYKYIVDGEWMTNTYEPVTPANKDGHINNYIQVVDKDPESISAALWKRLGADDFDLTTNEREIIKRFLDEYPDDDVVECGDKRKRIVIVKNKFSRSNSSVTLRCIGFPIQTLAFLPPSHRFRIPIPHIQLTGDRMQVARGSCVGKTYALAKLNDSSGGKRSKRRSKEERKGMVETFIKSHQASNDGNFPSLYLTHKEVGGSYYTVREIFRELIQENRVLAQPKLPPGEQNMENLDSFLENNPLGSISCDPNIHGLPSKDNHTTLVNEYESRRQKVLNSKWMSEMHGQNPGKADLINGSSHATMENEEFADPEHMELLKGQVLEGHNAEILEVEPCEGQIRHLSEDVVTETFPLRPVSSMIDNIDEETNEKEGLDAGLEVETGNNTNATVDTKLDLLQGSIDENITSSSQYLDSNNSNSSLQHVTFEETTTSKNESELQPSGTVQKQTADATLNRTTLDSCEAAAAAKPVSQETNPIMSFIKTVVAAFVKFWSE
ncbi:hypothetical protein SSX86_018490 [Deinandra increscens subsp. villosa]|uniref:Dual specificity protein phosphatase 4 n=1 Tax=Deinandra increscens subsp. villosa TaxID=3103831 RepID=A0AAP0CVL6_9ASTR